MDANQVGFVHEPELGRYPHAAGQRHHHQAEAADVSAIFGRRADALALLPGCRPSVTPREVGYTSVQAATNGIEFAKSPSFAARPPRPAALRLPPVRRIGNAANQHRKVGNLFDVKLRAIENLYANGVDIIPVITIVNGINNEQVGRIVQFAARQSQEDSVPLVPAGLLHRP